MNISVIIPTYNEVKRLPKTLKEVDQYLKKNHKDFEIIISDSASSDGTLDFVKSYQSKTNSPIKIIATDVRWGKGDGVKRGVLASSKKWILFMDADNSTRISEIEKLIPFTKNYQVVIGSRYAGKEVKLKQSIQRRIISRFGNLFISLLTGVKIKDTQCGFKLFHENAKKDIFKNLKAKGWGFDVELLMLAKRFGYQIKEVPIDWSDAEGSHLRAGQDSIQTFWEIIRIWKRARSL